MAQHVLWLKVNKKSACACAAKRFNSLQSVLDFRFAAEATSTVAASKATADHAAMEQELAALRGQVCGSGVCVLMNAHLPACVVLPNSICYAHKLQSTQGAAAMVLHVLS